MFDPSSLAPTDAFAVGLFAGLTIAVLFAVALWALIWLTDQLDDWEIRIVWRRK